MDIEQDELREILEEFFTEAEESLDQLEQDLIQLEDLADGGETDSETVDRLFRVLHTLKGGAGFLGLEKMAKLAHAGENLLDEVRGGSVDVTKPVMDALLATNDALRELLNKHKADENVEDVDTTDLVVILENLVCGDANEAPAAAPQETAPQEEPVEEQQPTGETPPQEEIGAESEAIAVDSSLVNQELLAEVQGDDSLDPSRDTGADEAISGLSSPAEQQVAVPEVDDSLVNQELLAEVQGDGSLDPSKDPEAGAQEGAAAPEVDDSLVNQELLAEVQGDDSLDPSKDPEAGAQEEAAAPEVDDSLVNQELLAEVQGDDSLDPSKDPEAGAQEEAAAPEVDDSLVNQELLAEVQGDGSLDPSKDQESQAAAPETKQEKTQPQAEPAEIKRGDKPEERRKEQGADRRQAQERRQVSGRRTSDVGNETVRVEVSRLDKVMNLVGELVLARNSLMNQLGAPETKAVIEEVENLPLIQNSLEQLSRVTQDLQMSVLSTRMQPIKKVFDKIPRQVRELKTKLEKEVDLIVEGEMTEVDKSLVEELSDPMVHMIRNALDHGIETPAERKEVGKHPTGTLTVRAFYEGNNVVVQVAEDGKGIDPERIKKIAVGKEIISEAQANSMSDSEAVRLIMAAGFSTAEVISDVSGRGVGMDVVNSKISNLKGTLDIKSELGVGTTFSIYLPLTLAIVQALVVASNREGFAIPIGDISEVIKFDPASIHKMNDQDVIELRGQALPLFYLANLTKVGCTPDEITPVLPPEKQVAQDLGENKESLDAISLEDLDAAAAEHASQVEKAQQEKQKREAGKIETATAQELTKGFVVVVRDGSNSMGLVVDQLLGQEEAVVKPVTNVFEFNDAISGATITGDGTVHMILDVPFMLKNLSIINKGQG
jgi:two-component system chemotaxis sensor kinase CheA